MRLETKCLVLVGRSFLDIVDHAHTMEHIFIVRFKGAVLPLPKGGDQSEGARGGDHS